MNRADWLNVGVILLLAVVGLATVLFSLLVWRTGYRQGFTAARRQPPLCPRCGYDLSGQIACRCPECGTEYRLDELWKSAGYAVAAGPRHDG